MAPGPLRSKAYTSTPTTAAYSATHAKRWAWMILAQRVVLQGDQSLPNSSAPLRQKKRSRASSSKLAIASPKISNGRRPPSGCG